jgi:hypothetical protein|tara:strand:- start:22544 stop:24112 length:1569 start_codon:yes stop_codon:yes gene_type:complete
MSDRDNYYLGNPNVRGADVEHPWTKDELKQYKKCLDDPVYFAKTYCKIINLDDGLVDFELYPYQKVMFEQFEDNRFNICLACRQSGKSIAVVAYLLWYAIFKGEQVVGILANKEVIAREMLGRITLMLENLPFFLQPGCTSLNKKSITFSNNSRLIASATSSSSIRGMSLNLVYLDEFAFVDNATEFYTSTYPVISGGKTSKVIITSTANGIGNMFHKLYEGAIQKTNEFVPYRVDWWDVPGRDEAWKQTTIENTSPLQFDQEFGNSFHGTGNTLLSADILLSLRASEPAREWETLKMYKLPIVDHNYIMTVDVSKGRGQDYSTFTIIDVSLNPFEQVCVFRDNTMSPLLFPDMIYKYATHYNMAYVVVESNDAGQVVCNGLYYDLEYENVFVESMIKANAIGITMTRKVKRIGCSNIKDILEQGKLIIHDEDTIREMSTFIAKGSSYEADHNSHDDLMMNLVLFGWFSSTVFFKESTDVRLKHMLYKEKVQQLQDEVIPIGNMPVDQGVHPFGKEWKVWNG